MIKVEISWKETINIKVRSQQSRSFPFKGSKLFVEHRWYQERRVIKREIRNSKMGNKKQYQHKLT